MAGLGWAKVASGAKVVKRSLLPVLEEAGAPGHGGLDYLGFGFRVSGFGCRVLDDGFRVSGLEKFEFWGTLRVPGSGVP